LVPLIDGVSYIQEDYPADCANHAPPQLAIYHAILLEYCVWIVEDFDRVIKVDPMLAQIALGLLLVPLE
jgi:hypothetical protein